LRSPRPLEILHLDDWLVVASKPGGMLVHRSAEAADRVFLLQELREAVGRHLYPVHRLDRAASGAIAFAFSSEGARELQARLGAADACKEYLALVRGSTPERGEIDRPLKSDKGVPQEARTAFERLAETTGCSLLRVRITTGRRHQIRRHLAHIKHQLLGDSTYGKGRINAHFRECFGLPRLFLHAARLELDHPGGGGRLRIVAPLAADLREFLQRLPDVSPELVASL
jgi:tRNA pseudouridine65 synthase